MTMVEDVEDKVSGLGNALTALGIEDRFLSDGELTNFPLLERGRIANGIIAEKLRLGRWQTVVEMMYGGFGKADALYEGDRDQLRDDIVRTAVEHSKSARIHGTIDVLAKAGENDLLFRLATNIPSLNYEDFMEATHGIDSSYFKDAAQGVQRKHTLHEIAGKKALAEGEYSAAFMHFDEIKDLEGLAQVFDATLALRGRHSSGEWLERIALSDPAQEDDRLKRVVLSSLSDEGGGLNPLAAYELAKKYNVALTSKEVNALRKKGCRKYR